LYFDSATKISKNEVSLIYLSQPGFLIARNSFFRRSANNFYAPLLQPTTFFMINAILKRCINANCQTARNLAAGLIFGNCVIFHLHSVDVNAKI
jgi:hypothetical protein